MGPKPYFIFLTIFRIVLEVKATDDGLPSLSSECEVEIKILDENDNDPKISLTPVYPDAQNPKGKLYLKKLILFI